MDQDAFIAPCVANESNLQNEIAENYKNFPVITIKLILQPRYYTHLKFWTFDVVACRIDSIIIHIFAVQLCEPAVQLEYHHKP